MKSFIMWTAWLGLLAVWIQTLVASLVLNNDVMPMVMAVVVGALLYILYFAEGLELAVADLRDKEPSQISDPRTRAVLGEMQARSEFFFSQRQIFVVSIITFVSLTLDYEGLFVWPLGWIHNPKLSFLFGLSFVTLSILWFCQVAPKRLAIIDSERFLSQSLFVWPLVRAIGYLGLVAPVEQIVSAGRKMLGYENARLLLPSPVNLYDQAAQRYGVAVDNLHVHVHLKADGTATIRKRFVLLYSHGNITQFGGSVEPGFSGPAHVESLSIHPLYLGTMAARESLREVHIDLDALSEQSPETLSRTSTTTIFSDNLLSTIPVEASYFGAGAWSLNIGMPLPEGLSGSDPQSSKVAVMVCEVLATCSEGVFNTESDDFWIERFDLPCRRFQLSVTSDAERGIVPVLGRCTVGLGDLSSAFESEQRRVDHVFLPNTKRSVQFLSYPAQGAVYKVAIQFLHVTASTARASSSSAKWLLLPEAQQTPDNRSIN